MNARKIVIEMALRRAARGHGSHATFLMERTAMQAVPDFTTMLGAIRWVLVGGIATRAYMPERITHDIDILIHADDAARTRHALEAAGYHWIGPLSIGGFAMQRPGEPIIDVLTSAESWVESALAAPTLDPAGLPVLGLPYLILMKLETGRVQDIADCTRMLHGTSPELRDTIRRTLHRENASCQDDFEQLILLADYGMEGMTL